MRLLWWAIPLGVVLGVVGAFVISRALFGHDDPSVLRALKADPMARYVPPHVVARLPGSEHDGGTALGQLTEGELTRAFRIRQSDAAGAFRAALHHARRSGWQLTRLDSGTAIGRSDAMFDGRLWAAIGPDLSRAPRGQVVLSLRLSARPSR